MHNCLQIVTLASIAMMQRVINDVDSTSWHLGLIMNESMCCETQQLQLDHDAQAFI